MDRYYFKINLLLYYHKLYVNIYINISRQSNFDCKIKMLAQLLRIIASTSLFFALISYKIYLRLHPSNELICANSPTFRLPSKRLKIKNSKRLTASESKAQREILFRNGATPLCYGAHRYKGKIFCIKYQVELVSLDINVIQ